MLYLRLCHVSNQTAVYGFTIAANDIHFRRFHLRSSVPIRVDSGDADSRSDSVTVKQLGPTPDDGETAGDFLLILIILFKAINLLPGDLKP